MTFSRIKAAAAALLIAGSAAAIAHAQPHGRPFHWPGARHADAGYLSFLEGVQLTDAQRQQVRQIMSAAWRQNHDQVSQLHSLQRQIADQLASGGAVTAQSVEALQQQAAQLRDQLDAERLAAAIEVRDLLTPDQLARSADVHKQLSALREQERALLRGSQRGQN